MRGEVDAAEETGEEVAAEGPNRQAEGFQGGVVEVCGQEHEGGIAGIMEMEEKARKIHLDAFGGSNIWRCCKNGMREVYQVRTDEAVKLWGLA